MEESESGIQNEKIKAIPQPPEESAMIGLFFRVRYLKEWTGSLLARWGTSVVGIFYLFWALPSLCLVILCRSYPGNELNVQVAMATVSFLVIFTSGLYPLLVVPRRLSLWCAAGLIGMLYGLWSLPVVAFLACGLVFGAIPAGGLGVGVFLLPVALLGITLFLLSVWELFEASVCACFMMHVARDGTPPEAGSTAVHRVGTFALGTMLSFAALWGVAAPAVKEWSTIRANQLVEARKGHVRELVTAGRVQELEAFLLDHPDFLTTGDLDRGARESLVNAAAGRDDVPMLRCLSKHGVELTLTAVIALDEPERLSTLIETEQKSAPARQKASQELLAVSMQQAVRKGRTECLKVFLKHGMDVDAKPDPIVRETALHIAAGGGNGEIVQLLLASGADPHLCNGVGDSPLGAAVKHGEFPVASILIRSGADPNRGEREPPLVQAIVDRRYDGALWLLEQGADPNSRSKMYGPALDLAIGGCGSTSNSEAGKNQAFTVVQLLLKKGASTHPPRGGNPLKVAAVVGNSKLILLLLSSGAEVNAADEHGNTVLHHLAGWPGNIPPEAILILLEHGADPNLKNQKGLAPSDIAKASQEPASRHFLSMLEEAIAARSSKTVPDKPATRRNP